MENLILPPELSASIGSEHKDFVVKAGRAQPFSKSLFTIIFGIIWTSFTSIFVFGFLGPLFSGKDVHFTMNGKPTVASLDNLTPLIFPAGMIGIFLLVGITFIALGLYSTFRKGGYFVGTETRLVHFRNGTTRSIDWEQFSGDIAVKGNEQKGNISLKMRSGKMVNQKNGPNRYVPEVIYISTIPNVYEIERICRKRIKENDPTPVTT